MAARVRLAVAVRLTAVLRFAVVARLAVVVRFAAVARFAAAARFGVAGRLVVSGVGARLATAARRLDNNCAIALPSSAGDLTVRTPAASSARYLSAAVPLPPAMTAPA